MPASQVTSNLQSSAGITCMKLLLTIFNVVFWLSGIAVLTVGIWTQLELQQYMKLSAVYYEATPYVLIAVGGVIILVGSFGCCCTLKGYGRLLYLYAMILILVFMVELSVAICAFVYRQKVESGFDNGLDEAMDRYRTDSDLKTAVDGLQTRLQCCGRNSYKDWFDIDWSEPRERRSVPPSCCKKPNCANTDLPDSSSNDTLPVYADGCIMKVTKFVDSNFLLIGGVAIGFAFLQLFGALLSCCLGKHINKHAYEEMA